MSRTRHHHLRGLNIGATRPNVLLPVLYGALNRAMNGTGNDEIAARATTYLKAQKPSAIEQLKKKVAWYGSLPSGLRRVWSGDGHLKDFEAKSFKDVADSFIIIAAEAAVVRRWTKRETFFVPPEYGGDNIPGAQRTVSHPAGGAAVPAGSLLSSPSKKGDGGSCCCVCGQSEEGSSERPRQPPGEGDLNAQRFMWELGPDIKCQNAEEETLGDDLYLVSGWVDGAGDLKFKRIKETGNAIVDLDKHERKSFPYPDRIIYPSKAPLGYLHIEVDFWERDYSLDFLAGMLDLLSEIAKPIGTLIGGAAGGPEGAKKGGEIGAVVGDGLASIRTLINDEDDDDYLGALVFDYPRGAADLSMFVGAGTVELKGGVPGDGSWRYDVDYVIRRT